MRGGISGGAGLASAERALSVVQAATTAQAVAVAAERAARQAVQAPKASSQRAEDILAMIRNRQK